MQDPKMIQYAQWGFIPAHAMDPRLGLKYCTSLLRDCIEYPPLRAAFKHRRCVILTDGYYEWKKVQGGFIPYRIEHKKKELLYIAGVYNFYTLEDGRELLSFSILLTKPNAKTSEFETPMPYILTPEEIAKYFAHSPSSLESPQASFLRVFMVDTEVNNPLNNSPDLIEPKTEVTPTRYSGKK